MKIFLFILLSLLMVTLSTVSCDIAIPFDKETDSNEESSTEHTHSYNQKITEDQYLKSAATCNRSATYYYSCQCGEASAETFTHGTPAAHEFNKKSTSAQYLKSAATSSSAAIYYYSCVCGKKGTDTFHHGTALSSKWTTVNKTVYGITTNAAIHTVTDDNKSFCGNVYVGEKFDVIATDGTWYKIKYTCGSQDFAYVMCKYVTDNVKKVTFNRVEGADASLKDGADGVYLCKGLDEISSVFISRDVWGNGYLSVEEISETKDWIKVRYQGYDSNGGYHDASTVYYCSTKNLYLIGI